MVLRIWSHELLTRLLVLVTDIRDGHSADQGAATYEGFPLSCAELVSRVLAVHDYWLPTTDAQFLAVLDRDAEKVDPATAPEASILATATGKVGVRCFAGVIESNGGGVSIVTFDPARYTRAWILPAIDFVGRI